MKHLFVFLLIVFTQQTLFAEDPAHAELRQLKAEFEQVLKKRDIDGLVNLLHPNVVITWHNGEVSRGREGVKKFVTRMIFSDSPVVKEFQTDLDVDELTILYGNTGIAFGNSNDHLLLTEGIEINSKNRWTATLVKEKNKWLLTSAHLSSNLFDNPLLTAAKSSTYFIGTLGLILGVTIGFGVGRLFSKKG
ncbi:YybH family protein [Leptospira meyeri]|uniref:YybH family protein n=1 Tax=Leptospira meyeri TaxID=29508 RepID=UPI00055D2D0D|nr:nuclear transport factor 2 family protein [Leptospira meyeri]